MITKTIALLARLLLGGLLISAVLARLFFPEAVAEGTGFPPNAAAWLNIMDETGYLESLVYLTEFMIGLALISGIFVPLALVVFAPIHLNITLFHIFLDWQPIRIVQVIVMALLHLTLIYLYRKSYASLFERSIFQSPRWPQINVALLHLPRMLLGIAFLIPGAAKLFVPELLSQGDFLIDGIKATGYLYPLLGLSEVVGGLLLLSNRYIPFALVWLAPVTLNILDRKSVV